MKTLQVWTPPVSTLPGKPWAHNFDLRHLFIHVGCLVHDAESFIFPFHQNQAFFSRFRFQRQMSKQFWCLSNINFGPCFVSDIEFAYIQGSNEPVFWLYQCTGWVAPLWGNALVTSEYGATSNSRSETSEILEAARFLSGSQCMACDCRYLIN